MNASELLKQDLVPVDSAAAAHGPKNDGPTWSADQPSAAPTVADLYNELLYAVERKYPGESRHDTALRYIRDRETLPSGESQEATVKGAVQPSAAERGTDADIPSLLELR